MRVRGRRRRGGLARSTPSSAPSGSSTGRTSPTSPGRDRFAGASFHSAEWDDDDRRSPAGGSAVIGTGASAGAVHPGRSPSRPASCSSSSARRRGSIPTPNYQDELPDGHALAAAPRARATPGGTGCGCSGAPTRACCRGRGRSRVGPTTADRCSAMNDFVRQLLTGVPRSRVPRPRAVRQGAARPTRRSPSASSATTASGPRALHRDDVELVTDGHRGDHREGRPHRRRGRARGRRPDLRHRVPGVAVPHADAGAAGAPASTCTSGGTATPAPTSASPCPSSRTCSCLYGPNTNIVINGSIVYFSECEADYLLDVPPAAARGRATEPWSAAPRCTTPTTSASTPATGAMAWGAVRRQHLVQERQGPRRPELALQPARVLATDQSRPGGRLHVPVGGRECAVLIDVITSKSTAGSDRRDVPAG